MMQLLDYPQLVRSLGVSRSTLEDAVRRGQLVPTRIGRRVLFAPQDVAAYIERHRAIPTQRAARPTASPLTPIEAARAARKQLGL